MDAAVIVVIVVVVALILFVVARRAWDRSLETRREKAGELRVESTREEERARRAEVEAERKRGAAETARRRADRLDPDTGTPGGRFSFFRRRDDEVADEADRDAVDRDAADREEDRAEHRSLWDRLVHR